MRWLLGPRNPYLRSIHARTRRRAAWFTNVVDVAGERSKMTPWRRARGSNNFSPSAVKRRNKRYLLSARLIATVRGERGETKTQTHALDISESGIGTLAGEGWDIGTHLNLKLSLPVENDFLEIEGVVRHRTGWRCGLEFFEVSAEQQQVVHNVCKFLASRPGISFS
jgi:PilZ domain